MTSPINQPASRSKPKSYFIHFIKPLTSQSSITTSAGVWPQDQTLLPDSELNDALHHILSVIKHEYWGWLSSSDLWLLCDRKETVTPSFVNNCRTTFIISRYLLAGQTVCILANGLNNRTFLLTVIQTLGWISLILHSEFAPSRQYVSHYLCHWPVSSSLTGFQVWNSFLTFKLLAGCFSWHLQTLISIWWHCGHFQVITLYTYPQIFLMTFKVSNTGSSYYKSKLTNN